MKIRVKREIKILILSLHKKMRKSKFFFYFALSFFWVIINLNFIQKLHNSESESQFKKKFSIFLNGFNFFHLLLRFASCRKRNIIFHTEFERRRYIYYAICQFFFVLAFQLKNNGEPYVKP